MLRHLKISQLQHTGQLRPHEHTSYLPLAFLTLLVGMALVLFTFSAMAATPYDGPESGSIGLTGSVPANPPTTAATITSPKNGQTFTEIPITVSGTCPSGTIVEIYKNDIFAGSTPCESGKFSLQIDLLFGKNILKALVYDTLNQAGPESNTVTIFYDPPLPQGAPLDTINFSGSQLLLNTDGVFRGTFPKKPLNVPITVIGGTAPFAINVEWGDSSNQVIPRSDNSTFNASHKYEKPGTYKITLQGSDSKQLVAFLTVAAIINGQPDAIVAAASTTKQTLNKLLVLWPVYAVAATALVSFWLGERREKRILGPSDKSKTPPFGVMPQTPGQSS